MIGDLSSDKPWCRTACQQVGIIIVDVKYRLAPKHRFPTQMWDAFAALKWVVANAAALGVDNTRVSIGGFSVGGGNLAAVLALHARDDKKLPRLRLQLLIGPNLDARFVPLAADPDCKLRDDTPYDSLNAYASAPCMSLRHLWWFHGYWMDIDPVTRERQTNSWWCSPMLADSHEGLAPASIHVAAVDPLYSEAKRYDEKLNAAGTQSSFMVYQGMAHPFIHWADRLATGHEAIRDMCRALRDAHVLHQTKGCIL